VAEYHRAHHGLDFKGKLGAKQDTGALNAVVEHGQHGPPTAVAGGHVLVAANIELKDLRW